MTTTTAYRPRAGHPRDAAPRINATLTALGVPHTHDEHCWCRRGSTPARVMHWRPGDPVARFCPAGAA